jgi:hypothetical protein
LRTRAISVLVVAVCAAGPASAQPGVYQPNSHTLFYLPMDGPNAGAPENCGINNPSLLSYTTDRFGKVNAAIKVSAQGSYTDHFYIACSDTQIAASPSASFTLGYWTQITQFPNDGAGCTLGCDYRMFTILSTNGSNQGCSKYLSMDIGSGGSGDPDACQGGLNGNIGELTSSTSVIDGKWHNLVWVFDHSNQLISFYIDGNLNGTAALPDPPYTPQSTQYVAGAENGAFALNGNMDDLWIEDHAWTQGEVTQYYYALSNTVDISARAGSPTPSFMTQLQQAGITNVVINAPQPCPTKKCQYAIHTAGEQFNNFLGAGLGFQVAAYCYLHLATGSATGDVQANNCIAAIPQNDFPSIRFIALDVEDLSSPSPSNAITIISAAANTIAAEGKPVVIYTNAYFWNSIIGSTPTPQFSAYPLWNTTNGQGGFKDTGPPLSPSIASTVYCGSGIPDLNSFTPFGGWTTAQYLGSQYYIGPFTKAYQCMLGGALFGVSLDFDVFAPSLFQ